MSARPSADRLRAPGNPRTRLQSHHARAGHWPVWAAAGDDRLVSGKQIKVFLVDGTPGGLTAAEITNWTGHVLSARRSDLADLLKRDEAQRTGVYLLLGDDETTVGDARC